MVEWDNLRATLVAVLLLHLEQVVLHHLLTALRVVEDLLQVGNEFHQVIVLLMELIDTQASQLCQAHIDDGLRLELIEIEAGLQIALGIGRGLTVSDDVYHLVDIVDGDDQALEDVGTLLSLAQVVLGAADGDIVTVLYEVLDALLEREQTGTTLHQRNIVDRERTLQGGHLEQLVEQHIGIGIALAVDDDTHTLAARLIIDIGHALNLMLVGEIGDIGHEIGLIDTIGNLRDDNLVVGLSALDLSLGAHHDTAATCLISIAHTLQAIDIGTRREVGTRDKLHQAFGIDIGVVDIGTAAVDHFTQVMGRHVSSHTYGNTVATVHQQVRNLGRHHGGLLERVVEVVHHVDGLLVEVVHDVLTHLRESALRVTHGGRRVAVYRSEVTLTVNQRVAHVPLLGHTYEGTID